MYRYPDGLSLAQARAEFFADAGLGVEGGYGSRWVRIKLKPVPIVFPNTACRVRAAKLHDLHHVATGYGADWRGEAEIAAWEIASGCDRYGWAWLLNFGAFTVGLMIAPRRTFDAFKRGRRATNLYHLGFNEDALERESVGSLRARLRIEQRAIATRSADLAMFWAWAALAGAWAVTPWFLAAGFLIWRLR